MIEFLSANLGTIVVFLVVIAVVGFVTAKLIKDKKSGRSSCGCGCENCQSADICHKKENMK